MRNLPRVCLRPLVQIAQYEANIARGSPSAQIVFPKMFLDSMSHGCNEFLWLGLRRRRTGAVTYGPTRAPIPS